MAKKPAKPVKSQAKAKKAVAAKPKATAKAAKPVKVVASKAKPEKKAPAVKATAKPAAKTPLVKAPVSKAAPEVKAKVPAAKPEKAQKGKKTSVPSVMGSKPKKDADEMEDEFLDDDIEIDPELAEFVEDVAELEEADAEAQKALAGGGSSDDEDEEEVAAPLKKTPKEKSASERRIKKERDLLSGIDRNGDLSEIWQKFYDTHKSEKAKQYNMRETFEAKSALQHVKLGWGFILSNINDRLEVLFKEGIKILISNYKS